MLSLQISEIQSCINHIRKEGEASLVNSESQQGIQMLDDWFKNNGDIKWKVSKGVLKRGGFAISVKRK